MRLNFTIVAGRRRNDVLHGLGSGEGEGGEGRRAISLKLLSKGECNGPNSEFESFKVLARNLIPIKIGQIYYSSRVYERVESYIWRKWNFARENVSLHPNLTR